MTDGDLAGDRIRLSDADRDRAAQRLNRALVEGRITVTELDERLAQVYAARFSEDLHPPLADLPADPLLPTGVRASSTVVEPEDEPVLSTTSGSLRREGRWVLPPALRIEVGSGRVILDCTEAELVSARVTLTVSLRSGLILVRVPDGTTADIDGVRTRSGSAKSQVPAVAVPGRLHLVIRGEVQSGRLRVRGPRRGWFTRQQSTTSG